MVFSVIKLRLVIEIHFYQSFFYIDLIDRLDIVPSDGQHPPHKEHHQKCLLATGPMCRYASDLSPMLRILAGPENLTKLVDIDTPV